MAKITESPLSKEEEVAYKQAELVWRMAESKGYKEVFRPFLETKLNQSFPDPSTFKKEEEFLYAAKTASVFKKVIAELLGWVDAQGATAQALRKKKEGTQHDPFSIGRE